MDVGESLENGPIEEQQNAGARRLRHLFAEAARHHQAGRLDEAKRLYLEVLAIDVGHAPSLHGLGLIAQDSGNFDVAVSMMRRAIAADSQDTAYRFSLGAVLQARGGYDDALAVFRDVLHLDREHLLARFRVGNVLQLQNRLDEAIAEYQHILEMKPDAHDAQFNIANVLRLQGKLTEARVHYERALAMDPGNVDTLWNLGLLDLLEGNYAAGWPNYEMRHRRPTHGLRAFPEPQWKGEPLQGKRILLHAEQGLGDTLQFLRYVSRVIAAGGQTILDVPGTIQRLATAIPGVAEVVATGETIPPFDVQCPLMSLPLAFQTSLDSIPGAVPYLSIPEDAKRAAIRRPWPAQGLRVGLVWGATPRFFEDSDRSIPLAFFEPVLATQGAHFFSLQMGPSADQLDKLQAPLTDLREAIGDFADTAALVAHLDLVITVDTSVAHVAGGLGKPTWVLLPFSPDWRWLIDREDSPWYPTARLFRQPRPRDWESVMKRVRSELALISQKENH
ncbi:MAG: tetratricopeptide repeat-containing glycosyltransferase family protein [Terracidiphilus sp.]